MAEGMTRAPLPSTPAPPDWAYQPMPDPLWRTETGRMCRMVEGSPRRRCQEAAVAAMNRGYRGKAAWWQYCAGHLYGRWIEAGKVMRWVLKKVPEDGDSDA